MSREGLHGGVGEGHGLRGSPAWEGFGFALGSSLSAWGMYTLDLGRLRLSQSGMQSGSHYRALSLSVPVSLMLRL